MPVRESMFAPPGAAWDDPVVQWGDPLWRYDGRIYAPLSWGGPGPDDEKVWGRVAHEWERYPPFEVPGGVRP
jgi:hypothetical protein